MDEIRPLILERVKALGLDLAGTSRAIGRNHAYLHQFIHRGIPATLGEDARERLAAILRIEPATLKQGGPPPSPLPTDPASLPPIPLLSMRNAMENGMFEIGPSVPPIRIARPVGLAGRERIYALRIETGRMEPAHAKGDFAFIDPARLPSPGRDAVIVFAEKGKEPTLQLATFARIAEEDADTVTIETFRPKPWRIRLVKSHISAMHLVLRNCEIH